MSNPTTGVDFVLYQSDLGPALNRELGDDNGSQFTLVGAIGVTFTMTNRDTGYVVADHAPARIIDGPNRIVAYDWQQGNSDLVGLFYAVFTVTFPDGRPVTFPNDDPLVIEVRPKLA